MREIGNKLADSADEESASPLDESISVRNRLIDVASEHFAEYGLQGASQRAIQREVGVNPGAANYYFGSKEALYLAVLEEITGPLRETRTRNLEQVLDEHPAIPRLRPLLRAYLAPLVQLSDKPRGYSYLRILVALYSRPDFGTSIVHKIASEMWERYVDQLSMTFPDVSRNRIYEVFRTVVCLAALTRIHSGPGSLSEQNQSKLINDVTEMSAVIFERLCANAD